MSDENQPISDAAREELGASRKERHDFLATLLKETRSSLTDFMFRQTTVITVLLGWGLSSKEARDFLHTHPPLLWVFIPAICFYFLFLVFWIRGFWQRSNSAYQILVNLRYMPKEFYIGLRVTNLTAAIFIAAFFILFAVVIAALLQI
jgi:FtsH-binding integral membrane protein